jgi:hypothetical protein
VPAPHAAAATNVPAADAAAASGSAPQESKAQRDLAAAADAGQSGQFRVFFKTSAIKIFFTTDSHFFLHVANADKMVNFLSKEAFNKKKNGKNFLVRFISEMSTIYFEKQKSIVKKARVHLVFDSVRAQKNLSASNYGKSLFTIYKMILITHLINYLSQMGRKDGILSGSSLSQPMLSSTLAGVSASTLYADCK